jgi:hypothetical protein
MARAGKDGGVSWDDAPPAATPAATVVSAAPTVRVKCVVHTKPWTHEKHLAHGEEAHVPQHVADVMLKNGQVEVI